MSPNPPGAEERAPAKINLYLHVGPPQSDGRHPLDSLVVFADVGDVLAWAPDEDFRFEIMGPQAAGLSAGEDNLVVRAARLLSQHLGRPLTGRLTLRKHLPVASGIGGGSADAGAALRLLDRVWKAGVPLPDLARLSEPLGGDVPVCVMGMPAIMQGGGERLLPAPLLPDLNAVLVNPLIPAPTGPVFQAYDGLGAAPELVLRAFPQCGSSMSATQALKGRRNDLEPAARSLVPVIGEVLEVLRAQAGVRLARMSGSGATCFAVFETALAARAAANVISTARPAWWTVATRLMGHSGLGRR
jgi:4-diphosphocytidyl-2-C-methyl-D-erythritol kinase